MHKGSVARRFVVVALWVALASTAAGADSVVIAPYVQNVTPDGVTFMWETEEPCAGEVEYGADFGESATESAPATIHRVRVTGLDPDSECAYRIQAAGETFTSVVKTAPDSSRPIVFVVMGDSRRWDKKWEYTRMAEHMMQWNPEFIINNGDLVVSGHTKDLWPEHFRRFTGVVDRLMMIGVRGNHEELRLTDVEKDWLAKYHEFPGDGEPFYAMDWGNSHFVFISFDAIPTSPKLLDEHLATVDKKHTFVVFHFPIYCTGYRSFDDSRKETGFRLSPVAKILDKHQVDVHFAGHTHIFERSYPLRDNARDDRAGTTYVVQGGDINANYPDWWSAFADDNRVQGMPTYTVVRCENDQIDMETFAWSRPDEKIVSIDHCIRCSDESVPEAVLATLPTLEGEAVAQAIERVGAMMYAPAADPLLPYLKQTNEAVRRATAVALRRIGTPAASEGLALCLMDPDLEVRREAAKALEMALPESLADTAARHARDAEQDPDVRIALLGALQLRAPADLTVAVCKDVLEGDASDEVRRRAAYAIAHVADKDDVDTLLGLVAQEPDRFALLCLGHGLGNITKKSVNLSDKGPFASSKPGERQSFLDTWVGKK
ncbi:MAG TPA: HEAT repeat domain-containing protein [Candidatus Hydrogenedentes bacterium]|nr:HEAT repeat domain-containing protein [Candidatus Hydrogenedentota bacterium]HPG67244.1 HEAT repeat domain-containing protein [Candidatus Hydrogenedentota bacterium]